MLVLKVGGGGVRLLSNVNWGKLFFIVLFSVIVV